MPYESTGRAGARLFAPPQGAAHRHPAAGGSFPGTGGGQMQALHQADYPPGDGRAGPLRLAGQRPRAAQRHRACRDADPWGGAPAGQPAPARLCTGRVGDRQPASEAVEGRAAGTGKAPHTAGPGGVRVEQDLCGGAFADQPLHAV